jgi:hypothetical protein
MARYALSAKAFSVQAPARTIAPPNPRLRCFALQNPGRGFKFSMHGPEKKPHPLDEAFSLEGPVGL